VHQITTISTTSITIPPNIPNPSAEYCYLSGYQYIIKTDASGQYGVCVFSDGSSCKGWDFFEGKCGVEYSYCEKHGGVIQTTTSGCTYASECANCILSNGTQCDEWEYIHGRCLKNE